MPRPAVFLDRDGTLIEERHYPVTPAAIVPVRGAGEALARLALAGYVRIVLTNQSAVARGLIDEQELGRLHDDMADKLGIVGGTYDALYYCPHHPEGRAVGYAMTCSCRKPRSGMLDLALAEHDVDLAQSCFIGDSTRDLFPDVAGVGARILVQTGHELGDTSVADFVAPTITEAVDWWLAARAEIARRQRAPAPPPETDAADAPPDAAPAQTAERPHDDTPSVNDTAPEPEAAGEPHAAPEPDAGPEEAREPDA